MGIKICPRCGRSFPKKYKTVHCPSCLLEMAEEERKKVENKNQQLQKDGSKSIKEKGEETN